MSDDICPKCGRVIPPEDYAWCQKCEKSTKRCLACNTELKGDWCPTCQLESPEEEELEWELENLDEEDLYDDVSSDDIQNGGYPT